LLVDSDNKCLCCFPSRARKQFLLGRKGCRKVDGRSGQANGYQLHVENFWFRLDPHARETASAARKFRASRGHP